MTPANIFGSILFGAIGMGAFVYGRKNDAWRPVVIGIALMIYPYFIGEAWMMYAIGTALTAALFIFRE